jgi:hypothetical protein
MTQRGKTKQKRKKYVGKKRAFRHTKKYRNVCVFFKEKKIRRKNVGGWERYI